MFTVHQNVIFQSTEELHTKWDGSKGTIEKLNFMNKQGWHVVFIWNLGETAIFHKSQMRVIPT